MLLPLPIPCSTSLTACGKCTGFREATSEPEANSGRQPRKLPLVPSTTEAGRCRLKVTQAPARCLDWAALPGTNEPERGSQFEPISSVAYRSCKSGRSRVINVTFQWTSPEKAADIVNRSIGRALRVQSNTEAAAGPTSPNEMARSTNEFRLSRARSERTSAALHEGNPTRVRVQAGASAARNKRPS